MPNNYLIIPAGGIGKRMNANLPKQYLQLDNGLSVLDQSLKTLLELPQISGCIIALNKNCELFKKSIFYNHPKILTTVTGGKERAHSVINAMQALKDYANDDDWVLVHDAVRPCVKKNDIINLITQIHARQTRGILATKAIDTIKKVNNDIISNTVNRENLWHALTPQMYSFATLFKALTNTIERNLEITDEASAIESLGAESIIVNGSKTNIKITTEEDLKLANFYLQSNL